MLFELFFVFSRLRSNPYFHDGRIMYSYLEEGHILALMGSAVVMSIFFGVAGIVGGVRGVSLLFLVPLAFCGTYTFLFLQWLFDIFLILNPSCDLLTFSFFWHASALLLFLIFYFFIYFIRSRKEWMRETIVLAANPVMKVCGILIIILFVVDGVVRGFYLEGYGVCFAMGLKWIICFQVANYIADYYLKQPWLLDRVTCKYSDE